MNTTTTTTTTTTNAIAALAATPHMADRRHSERQARPGSDRLSAQYRERDFGIGYGSSSGYVRNRSYIAGSDRPLFRVA